MGRPTRFQEQGRTVVEANEARRQVFYLVGLVLAAELGRFPALDVAWAELGIGTA